jgi:hypothetical protein
MGKDANGRFVIIHLKNHIRKIHIYKLDNNCNLVVDNPKDLG